MECHEVTRFPLLVSCSLFPAKITETPPRPGAGPALGQMSLGNLGHNPDPHPIPAAGDVPDMPRLISG